MARGSRVTKADVAHLFDLLPKEVPSRGPASQKASSFSCGAYAKGGLQGLRTECATFPSSVEVLTNFVKASLPGHFFSTITLFHNTKTDLHVDSRNHHTPNGVIAISSFSGGGIWVADGSGPVARTVKGQQVQGTILNLSSPVLFNAFQHAHQTEAWQGDRLVCVAFTVSDLSKLSIESAHLLLKLGFRPPPDLAFPIPISTQDAPPLAKDAWVYELFSGTARLSKACRDLGFKALGFDHSGFQPCSATAKLDLTLPAAQKIFWDIMAECPPFHVHAAPPCGTASRARERPLPRNHALASKPPKPLRSDDFPLGLPTLDANSSESLRVRKANALYRLTYQVLRHCSSAGLNVSVENPRNSLFWNVLERFAEADGASWPPPALEFVDFGQCCHGSDRPKATRFLCTRGLFSELRARCPGDHAHKPWGLVFHEKSMQFATSLESAYPQLLCKRMAACLQTAAAAHRIFLTAAADLTTRASAATGRQTHRFPPLIPEFVSVTWEPASFQPDSSCKILLSHAAGEDIGREGQSEPSTEPPNKAPKTSSSLTPKPQLQGCVKVGRYLSMQDHVAKALTLKHPVDTVVALDQDQLDAISFCMEHSDNELINHRKLQLLKIKILAKKLEPQEAKLHSTFEPWFEKVVGGKKLLLWKELLEQISYDDMQVIDFMFEGVPIVGTSTCPSPFKQKVVPAAMSEDDLRSTAAFRRKAMTSSSREIPPDLQKLLSQATGEEVNLGFLEGPFTEKEVSDFFHTDDWNCIRRFLILQGSEKKPRPIDDGHEALINNCYTSMIKLELQSSDFVTCMAKNTSALRI